MPTKIDGVSPGQVNNSISQSRDSATERAPAGADNRRAGASEQTTVELTSNAVLLGKLDQALAAVPDVDVKRVEAIKSAIADGSYEVDAERIAAELLKLDDDLS